MEEGIVQVERELHPIVLWDQPDLDKFVVSISTPGILPRQPPRPHEAKNGYVDVTMLKEGMHVMIDVRDATKNKKTIYTFIINQFPSPINKQLSNWKVAKDKVVISLHKKEPIDWRPLINEKGLDQRESSSSSEDEEAVQGAAVPKSQGDRGLRLIDLAAAFNQLVFEKEAKKPDLSDDDQTN